MAASTLSLGIFAARAFCTARRRAGLESGLPPPAFTAIAMSLLMRVNSFAILFQRANMVALRVSKMRPMEMLLLAVVGACQPGSTFDFRRAVIRERPCPRDNSGSLRA